MLTLVLRRAVAQARLLAGVVVLVTLGTTLLGVGALLLTTTQDRAFTAGVRQSSAEEVDVTAFLVGLAASDEAGVRDDARSVVRDTLGPLGRTTTSNAVSRMRRLGDAGLAYVASTDSLSSRAALTMGRWTDGPGEAVVPQATAAQLHLTLGDRVELGKEIGSDPVDTSVTVVVVGEFRPTSRSGWEGDPLGGSGYDASFSDGSLPTPTPAYGPFVVNDATFRASGSTVDALQVTGHPALQRATGDSLAGAVRSLRSADDLLSERAGGRADITRVASDLPQTLTRIRAQQAATRSTVLVVLLLGTTLALTALLLAGRLLAGVREAERVLLSGLGVGRGRLALATLMETLLVVVVATAVATPAAALVHSALSHLQSVEAAGLGQGPGVTAGLLVVAVAGAFVLALALAAPGLVAQRSGGRTAVSLRSGVDLLLVVIAVAAGWQLHSQPATDTSGDVTRTLAPVVCVLAATAVAVRLAPLVLAVIARAANRSTALVLPLASNHAARRPYAGAALVLLAMAAASATFALTLEATWQRSQSDQAALRVGTDLNLRLTAPATARDAADIVASTRGSVASAVVDRPLALGRYTGEAGSAPVLVALDARRAGDLLRGRLDEGRTWSHIGALLAPRSSVAGLPMASSGLRFRGSAPAGVEVTPTLVVQDRSGFRSTMRGDAVPLDGRDHRLRGMDGLAGRRLVAVRFSIAGRPGPGSAAGTVSMDLLVPDTGSSSGRAPDVDVQTIDASDSPIQASAVQVRTASGGTTIGTTAQVDLQYLSFARGDLLVTAFEAPDVLPVAVSRRLADAVGVTVGGELKATVGGVEVPLRIAAIVPAVPSEPGRIAVLADVDTLSRLLIGAGRIEPVADAWWVARPTARTTRAVSELGLGTVTTADDTADELRQGPLRVSVPAALGLLVVAAALLLLAGTALSVGADRPARSAEIARLRALGLTRRDAFRLGLVEHGILLCLLVPMGALVGAGAAFALGPDLIRSDVGLAPVPTGVVVWPWERGAAVVAAMLVGSLVIAAAITFVAVRRSGPAQLRAADA